MTEEMKKQIHELYNDIMDKPNKILQIFQDFFGEDKVDMQGFLSEKEFYDLLSLNSIKYLIPKPTINNSISYKELSDEERKEVDDLWDKVLTDKLYLGDLTTGKYIFPIIKEWIPNTDFNDIFIIVSFPKVRITNEYDKYVDIKELWAKVGFNWEGKGLGYFELNRSNYPLNHFKRDYLHSHVSSIPREDFTKFRTPCTGNGPIRSSLSTLVMEYDESIWQLFCLELDKYVRVESIAGGPYRRLEEIPPEELGVAQKTFSMNTLINPISPTSYIGKNQLKEFIKCLLNSNKLKFNYINGSYALGMPFTEAVVTISNEFIDWYNAKCSKGTLTLGESQLIRNNIIKECIIISNKIYFSTRSTESTDYQRYVGEKICTFKGRDITLTIDGVLSSEEEESLNKTRILDLRYIEAIVSSILRIVNYGYGRQETGETSTGASAQTRYF